MSKFIILTSRSGESKAMRVDDIRTVEQEALIDDQGSSVVTLLSGAQFVVKETISFILKQIDKTER